MTNQDVSGSDADQPAELTVAHPTDTVSVIIVNCELDMATTPAFGQLLTQELDSGHPVVLVDLSGCEFMGSSGLATLVAAREHAAPTGTRLALAGLTRTVTRALSATHLESLFTIFPTTDDALTDLTRDT